MNTSVSWKPSARTARSNDGSSPTSADRAFVLITSRMIHSSGEHGLALWLETDFVGDREGRRFVPRRNQRGRVRVDERQIDSGYRTLDTLLAAKGEIGSALYGRLQDLFSMKPELVLYDATSAYFEGSGSGGVDSSLL